MLPKYLIIPDEARDQVNALLELTAEQLTELERLLSDRATLKAGTRTYQTVAEQLRIGQERAIDALNAVSNLRAQRERYELSDETLADDLQATLGPPTKLDGARKSALLSLLRKSDDDYFVEKVTGLKRALLPRLVEAHSIVDARPVFNRDRDKIDGMVLVAYLELTTHQQHDESCKTTVIQLSTKDIAKLRQCLDDTEKKLVQLEMRFSEFDVYR